MTTRTKLLFASSAAALVAGAAIAFYPTVNAEQALPNAVSHLALAAPGRVEPTGEERVISARMPGTITTVLVEENARVDAGQVLAELDRKELLAQRRAAQAELAIEEAARLRLLHGARREERRQAQASLAQAEAQLAYAEREHSRRVPLRSDGVIADADFTRSTSELDAAKARRQELVEHLALLDAPARSDELAMSDARIELARARVEEIEAAIERTYVRAPIAGVVLRRETRSGETVGIDPPTPLFVIGDVSRLTVRAEVDELDVARIHVGQRAEITADAYPSRKFAGTVERVGLRISPKRTWTEHPAEHTDTKVLDALIALDPGAPLPVGLRVDVFVR